MSNEISDTDLALIELAALSLGSLIMSEPKKQEGTDTFLATARDHFHSQGNKKAAVIIEMVRKKATDFSSGPSTINALIERSKNPSGSH